MFLIVSELPIFKNYFARNWPLLSQSHGFVTLGVAMIVLGVNILGNLNKEATSQKSLGMAFWRIVIASGILVFVLGFFNIVAVSTACLDNYAHELTACLCRAMCSVMQAVGSLPEMFAPKELSRPLAKKSRN